MFRLKISKNKGINIYIFKKKYLFYKKIFKKIWKIKNKYIYLHRN